MKISVIVPVHNEERFISACLTSLKQQSLSVEIIVVDDGSKDRSVKRIKKIRGIHLFSQSHLGAALARNRGAKHARGDILVFVDADMTFDKNFIKALVKPIVEGRTKGTFTKEERVANWSSVWARCFNFETVGNRDQRRVTGRQGDEANVFRAVLKTEFDRVGGFEATGYTDDWTLAKKLGYLAKAAPNAICYHTNPDSLAAVFRQARWIGKRRYRFGEVGRIIALGRASLPTSLFLGVVKAFTFRTPGFMVFKLVYDLGVVFGILSFWLTKSHAR
ncbi:hypothetical protein A3A66_00990 [Microgenomates group bacterium RIFCSPLOWO2_01_FULL_46_13]|nr:MAG: hypothetical protein A3A66_00990 [Microgenomates group bacterium RIFCSPLOWO2_01_FULL_46_13]